LQRIDLDDAIAEQAPIAFKLLPVACEIARGERESVLARQP
jgi:hypothetical protein